MARTALNGSDRTALKNFIFASTNADFIDARTRGDTIKLMGLLNADASPAVPSWRISVDPQEVDEATPWTSYDAINPISKRESWVFAFLKYPRDFTRGPKVRKWVTDIWGNATNGSAAEAIFLGCAIENASVAENVIGGNTTNTNAVSALDRTFVGDVTQEDCQKILAA